MTLHKAHVKWLGDLEQGAGHLESGSGTIRTMVRFKARLIDCTADKTTPEELLAGAHATCLSA